MKDLSMLRERFLRDAFPVRLGGLVANLARIQSFSDHPDHRDIVKQLIVESEHFAEWAGIEAELTVQARLVELQILLARWSYTWQTIWNDETKLQAVGKQADNWAQELLHLSGLNE